MIWMVFGFNTMAMAVTIPQEKLKDIMGLAWQWGRKRLANNELRT